MGLGLELPRVHLGLARLVQLGLVRVLIPLEELHLGAGGVDSGWGQEIAGRVDSGGGR